MRHDVLWPLVLVANAAALLAVYLLLEAKIDRLAKGRLRLFVPPAAAPQVRKGTGGDGNLAAGRPPASVSPHAAATGVRSQAAARNQSATLPDRTYVLSRAYVDMRLGRDRPVLRLLAVRPCERNANDTFHCELRRRRGGELVARGAGRPVHLNSPWKCPWAFAPACALGPHYVAAPLRWTGGYGAANGTMGGKETGEVSDLSVWLGSDNGEMSELDVELHAIHPVESTKPPMEHDLAVCIVPVYLFADATLVRLFINAWTRLGATKFIVYAVSMSREVLAVMDDFRNSSTTIGIEMVAWPALPQSSTESGGDPNSAVYRFGHYLAINDCAMRTAGSARWAALVDFDEFILPHSAADAEGALLPVLRRLFADDTIGSVSFANTRLHYNASARHAEAPACGQDSTAAVNQWLWLDRLYVNGSELARVGPESRKFVFRPETVDIVANHKVLRFIEAASGTAYTELPASTTAALARLYHVRSTNRLRDSAPPMAPFDALARIVTSVAAGNCSGGVAFRACDTCGVPLLRDDSDRVLPRQIAESVSRCVSQWRHSATACKAPHGMCGHVLADHQRLWLRFDRSSAGLRFVTL